MENKSIVPTGDPQVQASENKAPASSGVNKRSLILPTIIMVLIISILVLFAVGNLSIVFKRGYMSVTLVGKVCNPGVVEDYNKIMSRQFDIGEKTDYLQKTDQLLSSLKTKKGFESDATCQFIDFRNNVYQKKDFTKGRENLKRIKELNDDKIYVNNNINNILSIKDMDYALQFYGNALGLEGKDNE